MKVSIVIPNYNGEKYLRECIESVVGQDYLNYEVIIIDNCSTDSRYEWISEYEDIQFIRLDKNYGFSKAVNEGIRMAVGEYVLLLNNDTVMTEYFLGNMVQAIEADSKIFAVSSKMLQYHNKNLIDDAGDEYNLLGWAYKIGDGKEKTCYTVQKQVFSACAGAALYRKAVFDKIGYFDENFFAYMEDVDISYRGRIYGYKNIYCPTAEIYHIGSATSGSKYNAFKIKLAARNNIYVPYKNMPVIQLIINVPFLLVGYIVKYVFFITKGYEKEYRQGILEGIKTLNRVEKVSFKFNNILNYFKIEWLLIKNTISYIVGKLVR